MNSPFILGLLLASLIILTPFFETAADWSQWRGPKRTGHSTNTLPPANITFVEVWKTNVGTGFSSIVVADGHVITMGNADDVDTVVCLDERTGDVLWKHSYPEPLDPNLFEGGPTATPTIADDRVYAISRRGYVACLSADSGEVVWKRQIVEDHKVNVPSWGFSGSPLIFEDLVVLNAGAHGIALDKSTGETIWQSGNEEDAGYTSPIVVNIDETPLVLLLTGRSLNAVHPRTGEVAWNFVWVTRYGINAADPIPVAPGNVIVSSGYGKGTALVQYSADSAEQEWRVRELRNQMSPGVLLNGRLYAVDGDNGPDTKLVCLDPATGEATWTETGFGSASLMAVGEELLLLSDKGELAVAVPGEEGLAVRARHSILTGKCWTPFAYANNSVFARNASGDLVKVTLK
ncbi:MAG: PQQ-like beta-propeller repeat protein [Planctomycetaceae bacterium]|nr:PQQ-like beta-propeller repeat protein [Planctomycetaceae bacterium]